MVRRGGQLAPVRQDLRHSAPSPVAPPRRVPGRRELQVLDAADVRGRHLGEGHVAVGGRLGEGPLLVAAQGAGRQPAGRQPGRGVRAAFDLAAGAGAVQSRPARPPPPGRTRPGPSGHPRGTGRPGRPPAARSSLVPGGQGGIGPRGLVPAVAQHGAARAGSGGGEAGDGVEQFRGGAHPAQLQRVQRDSGFRQVDVGIDEAGGQERAVQIDHLHGGIGNGGGGLLGADPGDGVAVDQHRGRKGIGGGVDGAVAVQRDLARGGGGR